MDSRWQNGFFSNRRRPSLVFVVILSLMVVAFYWSELFGNERADIILSQPTKSLAQGVSSSNFSIGKKVAAIIENRPSGNLIPLILHFSSVLGPTWPIVLFTSLSLSNFSDSAPFKAGLSDGQFDIRSLPSDAEFTSHKAVSSFLTKPWFWQQLAPADHVLLFQSDSIICANAPQRVDAYLQYDMIGAPIAFGMGQGYNGGLSLRNRNKMLDIIKKHNWEDAWETAQRNKAEQAENERLVNEQIAKEQEEKAKKEKEQDGEQKQQQGEEEGGRRVKEEDKQQVKRQEQKGPPSHTYVFPENPTPPWEDYEDQWFFKHLAELPKKWTGERGATLPDMEVAKTFSVETVYYDRPLGYHQVGLKITDKMDEIEKWCPEYHLCTDKRFESAQ